MSPIFIGPPLLEAEDLLEISMSKDSVLFSSSLIRHLSPSFSRHLEVNASLNEQKCEDYFLELEWLLMELLIWKLMGLSPRGTLFTLDYWDFLGVFPMKFYLLSPPESSDKKNVSNLVLWVGILFLICSYMLYGPFLIPSKFLMAISNSFFCLLSSHSFSRSSYFSS